MIRDWIDSFIEYTKNLESPLLYKEWVAVSVIAATLQRRCYVKLGPLTFYPNMYIVLVGPSGVRKGTAMRPGCSMLKQISGVHLASESVTREALIRSIKRASGQVIDPDTQTSQNHSALTIYSEELTVFLGYNNIQLISDLADWYDCGKGVFGEWTYETKSQGVDDIVGIWVNLIGATTPDLIASALPRDTIGGGLSSRMVFVYEDRKGVLISLMRFRNGNLLDEELERGLVSRLEDYMMVSGSFKVDDSFAKLYDRWYEQQEIDKPFIDPKFDGYIQRRPSHILKLSMVMNVSRGDLQHRTLTSIDFNRALNLLTRTEVNMPRTFSSVGRNEDVDVLSKIMYDVAIKKKMSMTELMQKYYSDVSVERMDVIIKTLEAMEFVDIIITETDKYIEYKGKKDNESRG